MSEGDELLAKIGELDAESQSKLYFRVMLGEDEDSYTSNFLAIDK